MFFCISMMYYLFLEHFVNKLINSVLYQYLSACVKRYKKYICFLITTWKIFYIFADK
jgi:hypothetical protein